MGASGTTVALETSDVALMADELDKLPDAIRLARRAMCVVHENVALSLTAIVVLVTAALAGQLTLTERRHRAVDHRQRAPAAAQGLNAA